MGMACKTVKREQARDFVAPETNIYRLILAPKLPNPRIYILIRMLITFG